MGHEVVLALGGFADCGGGAGPDLSTVPIVGGQLAVSLDGNR